MRDDIYNANVVTQQVLIDPAELKSKLPLTGQALTTLRASRQDIQNILDRVDDRLMLVVGPCSIHDPIAALDYAKRLRDLSRKVDDKIFIIMRVYFEKPRTTTGWKGLINDPYLNDSFNISDGLEISRQLLLQILDLGVPTATEALDPISPQYLHDLISWSAVGARTTESQTHREMASGLSSAVGFKNGTDGSLDVAINALAAASQPHSFLGINEKGQVSIIETRGNKYCHVVLRGGSSGQNYDSASIKSAEDALFSAGLTQNIMIDCSHANSNKNPENQLEVVKDVIKQLSEGNRSIIGLMVESNIAYGNQKLTSDLDSLLYGVSITDACIDWPATEVLCMQLHENLKGD